MDQVEIQSGVTSYPALLAGERSYAHVLVHVIFQFKVYRFNLLAAS